MEKSIKDLIEEKRLEKILNIGDDAKQGQPTKSEKTVQEQIEDKILDEILSANEPLKRYQLIQQLDLMSRALITIKDRKDNFRQPLLN